MNEYLQGYMCKSAGSASELLGMLNPLPYVLGPLTPAAVVGQFGGLGAGMAMQKKETPEDVQKQEDTVWKNLLVPGVAHYNFGKRLQRFRVKEARSKIREEMMKAGYPKYFQDRAEDEKQESMDSTAGLWGVGIPVAMLGAMALAFKVNNMRKGGKATKEVQAS
jgi:hypothetical protein